MAYDISIIIVNYDQKKLTLQCIESCRALRSKHSIHIVVVDNGSSEELTLPKKYQDANVTLLRSDANLGFTGGNNMGIHAAIERHNSDFVLLLNNDAQIEPRALDALCGCAQEHPEFGVISPKIYFYPGEEYYRANYSRSSRGKVFWYAGGSIDWKNLDNFHRGVDEKDYGHFDQQQTSDFATGCALLIRRETLEKVGLLRKDYFLYYEDADWSQRALRMGYQVGFCSRAKVWHHNAGSSEGVGSAIHQYYQTRNRLLFFWTHGNWRVRKTVCGLILRILMKGNKIERKGALDFVLKRFGKQPIA